MLRPWLELARISNLPTVWTNVLAGWLLAFGKWEWQPLAWLLVGGSLMYTAGMILNDAADVGWDQTHRKERPIPSGKVSRAAAWSVGLVMLLGGAAMAVWGAGACIWLTGALVAAIVAYDLFHKPWSGSVLIMGACRTLLYLVAGSAVTGGLGWTEHRELCVKAIVLGLYIVGLSMAARSHGRMGWSASLLLAPPLAALYYSGLEMNDPLRGAAFGIVGLSYFVFLCWALALLRRPSPAEVGRGVGVLLAMILVVDALAICTVAPVAAMVFAVSPPLLLLWQRKIAAT
jgi:4-hydroxybenzoate polyprenyltransferase